MFEDVIDNVYGMYSYDNGDRGKTQSQRWEDNGVGELKW